ncbi:MAG: serine hydrolase [Acidobacteriota bacterium]
MRIKVTLLLSLLLLVIFNPHQANIVPSTSTALAEERASTLSQNANLDERIRRVEDGLLYAVDIQEKLRTKMSLADRMKFWRVPGVSIAVINNNKIEWACGYGVKEAGSNDPVTTETLFQAASISKPVTAMAVLRLVQEGKLNLDEDINKKLVSWKMPENEFTQHEKVTLRRLLSHSAGLTRSYVGEFTYGENLPTLVEALEGKDNLSNPRPVRVEAVPGSRYNYSGGGYSVIQLLLIDVTGKPFPTIMKETVLDRIEMKHSIFAQPLPKELWSQAATGHRANGEKLAGKGLTHIEMAAGGLWTTAVDLARFAIEIQQARAGRSKVLSKEMASQMLTVHSGMAGLGLDLIGEGATAHFMHGGINRGFQSLLVAYNDLGQGAVIMTNADNGQLIAMEIFRSIAKEYGWQDSFAVKERAIAKVDSKIYDVYIGQYTFPSGRILNVTVENGKLMAEQANFPKYQLFPTSESEFFARELDGFEYKFVRDGNGNISELTELLRGRKNIARKTK